MGGTWRDVPHSCTRCAPRAATPVIVSGGIHNFEQAEAVLASGPATS